MPEMVTIDHDPFQVTPVDHDPFADEARHAAAKRLTNNLPIGLRAPIQYRSTWDHLPISENVDDRRIPTVGDAILSLMRANPPQWETIKESFAHPMTPIKQWPDTEQIVRSRLSVDAGLDAIPPKFVPVEHDPFAGEGEKPNG